MEANYPRNEIKNAKWQAVCTSKNCRPPKVKKWSKFRPSARAQLTGHPSPQIVHLNSYIICQKDIDVAKISDLYRNFMGRGFALDMGAITTTIKLPQVGPLQIAGREHIPREFFWNICSQKAILVPMLLDNLRWGLMVGGTIDESLANSGLIVQLDYVAMAIV